MKEKRIQYLLDIGAALGSLVPYIGGFFSTTISNISVERKLKNIKLSIESLKGKYKNQVPDKIKEHLASDEFGSLLKSIIGKVAEEDEKEMVMMYGALIEDAVAHPAKDNSEMLDTLKSLERERDTHISYLRLEKPSNKSLSYQEVGNYYRRIKKETGVLSSLSNAANISRQRDMERRIQEKSEMAKLGKDTVKLIFNDDPTC